MALADDNNALQVELGITLKKLTQQLAQAEARMVKTAKKWEGDFSKANAKAAGSMRQVNSAITDTGRRLSGLRNILLGAFSAREVIAFADAWTTAENKIAAAEAIAGKSARSLSEVNEIAALTRSALGPTADLYAKLLRSTADVAESELEVARATELVNKAFKAGGAAASEQSAGILQLSQALGSGFLQGDELRSLRENAPLLAQAIAAAFDTNVAGLKQLGAEGKLTADKVFGAILEYDQDIEAAFAATNATIGEGFTQLRNALTEYVATADDSVGATAKLGEAFAFLAEHLDEVVNVAVILGARAIGPALLSAFLNVRNVVLGASAALAGLSAGARITAGAMAALRGGLAVLGGPIGAVLVGLTALPLLLESNSERVESLRGASNTAATALDAYAEASARAADEQDELGGKVRTATREILNQSRAGLQEALIELKKEIGATVDDLRGEAGFFDTAELENAIARLNKVARPEIFPEGLQDTLGPANQQLRSLQDAMQDALDTGRGFSALSAEMERLAGAGAEVTAAVADLDNARADNLAEDLTAARENMVGMAEAIGGFEEELAAISSAQTADELVAGFDALRLVMLEAAAAGDVMRDKHFSALRSTILQLGLTEDEVVLLSEALGATEEELQEIRKRLQEGRGDAEALGTAGRNISFADAAQSAADLAKELQKAVDASDELAKSGAGDLAREKVKYEFRNDPIKEAGALAAIEFDEKISAPPGADNDLVAALDEQRRQYIATAIAAAEYAKKTDDARDAAKGKSKKTEKPPLFEASEDEIARLNLQIDALGQTAGKVAELAAQYELLREAKKRGLDLDKVNIETGKTLREEIEQNAATIGKLTQAYEDAAEKQQFFDQQSQNLQDGIIDAIIEGENLIGVLADMALAFARAALQAALFGSGPLSTLFGTPSGTGLLTGLLPFAEGGYTGDGGKNEPKGVVHGGEFVFSKSAVQKIGLDNLNRLHSQLKGFAAGGAVGGGVSQPLVNVAAPQVNLRNYNVMGNGWFLQMLRDTVRTPEGEQEIVNVIGRNQ